ncbi:MAG: integral rane sensor signal transduction histidine kinase [Sphingobacteriales bacterium]|nr:integral rane sensor signal transduction histidine kinase [Sphingobacteriales bacterium]
MKLFTRYNRIILLMMVLLFLISSILYYFLLNYILLREVDEVLHHRIVRMERFAHQTGRFPVPDAMGEVRVRYTLIKQPITGIQSSFVTAFDSLENSTGIFRKFVFTLPVNGQVYQVTLLRPLTRTRSLSITIILVTLSTILAILVLIQVINRTLLHRLWQPFYSIIEAMRSFKLGKIKEVELPETNILEFIFLRDNLKETIHRAEEEYQDLKEFTENASHELQMPLAIIRSKLDLLIQREDLSEAQSEELKEIYMAVKKISRLNGSLLLLRKIENHQFQETTLLNFKDKIEEKVQQFEELWKGNKLKLHCHMQDGFIQANEDLIDILLNNLLSNSSRHNIGGGAIFVNLQDRQLTVSNTGSPKVLDSKRIFTRFYKEGRTHHNGLGLSIIKQICDQSHIQIEYLYDNGKHTFELNW